MIVKIRSFGVIFFCFFSSALSAMQPPVVVNTVALPLPPELYLHIFSFLSGNTDSDRKARLALRRVNRPFRQMTYGLNAYWTTQLKLKNPLLSDQEVAYAVGDLKTYRSCLIEEAQEKELPPLHCAISQCNVPGVKALLFSGEDPSIVPSDMNINALLYAAAMKGLVDNPPCAQLEEGSLLEHLYTCMSQNLNGMGYAIQSQKLAIIEELLLNKVKTLVKIPRPPKGKESHHNKKRRLK